MQSIEMVRRFAVNNAWSNHRLLEACARLSRADFEATRTSFFPSIPATLNHILIVDWFYLDGLEEGGRGQACFVSDVPFPDLAGLRAAQRASDERLVAFTSRLENELDLRRSARFDRGDHVQTDDVGSTLLHLFVHQIHHRGQVHAMLSGTPVKPPQLDEFFMRDDLPLRAAELAELGLPPS